METTLSVRAAGVTFADGYPRNLLDLVPRIGVDGPLTGELVRDCNNSYDLNAVGVFIEGRRLGSLPADIAAFVAPQMDSGRRWRVEIVYIPVDIEHRDRPGLALELTRED